MAKRWICWIEFEFISFSQLEVIFLPHNIITLSVALHHFKVDNKLLKWYFTYVQIFKLTSESSHCFESFTEPANAIDIHNDRKNFLRVLHQIITLTYSSQIVDIFMQYYTTSVLNNTKQTWLSSDTLGG